MDWPRPDNSFKIGKPKLNRRRGTATLPVTVPGPGTLGLRGDGVVLQPSAFVERVIHREGRYQVVRKVHDAVAAVAKRLDPRGETA